MVHSKDQTRLLLVFPGGNKLPLEYSFSVSLVLSLLFFPLSPSMILCDLEKFTLLICFSLSSSHNQTDSLAYLAGQLIVYTHAMQWLPTTTSLYFFLVLSFYTLLVSLLSFYPVKISLTDSQTFVFHVNLVGSAFTIYFPFAL